MAAVAELSFLLFAFIINIHGAERLEIRHKWDSYKFSLPEEANYCLISRFVGEEKLVLWNTSALQESENSTIPEDLKRRLSVDSVANISSYMIQNLTHSDSGLYQKQCWGNETYESNVSIIICTRRNEDKSNYVTRGETVDLLCEGAADNQDVHWFRSRDDGLWTRVSGDNETSVMDNVEERPRVVSTSLRLRNHSANFYVETYVCLVMNHQQCVSSQTFDVHQTKEIIYHSVGEMAVFQCTLTDDQPLVWVKYDAEEVLTIISNTDPEQLNKSLGGQVMVQNDSLMLSSLTLNNSGYYYCANINNHKRSFELVVCPKSGPAAVELFSEGDNITFSCRGRGEGMQSYWFIRSDQTDGRLLSSSNVASDLRSRLDSSGPNGSLILYNVSLGDAGDYWCALTNKFANRSCMSTIKFLLKFREPSGINLTVYIVRCWLLTGLLVILCVTVVTVKKKAERREQRLAQTDG